MQMDPRIILAGQSPDIAGSAMNGIALGSGINDVRQTNALRNLYQEQGAGMIAGDQNALDALAGFDPGAALGMRNSLNAESRAAESHQAAIADRVARMTQQEAAASAEALRRGIETAVLIEDPETWDAFMAQNGFDDFVGTFENREQVLAQVMGLTELIEAEKGLNDIRGGGKPEYKVVGNQLYVIPADGSMPRPVGSGEASGAAFEVQTPDGVTLRYGATGLPTAGGGPIPAGQNPDTSATPRDSEKLSEKLSEADVAYLSVEREKARAAEDLESVATQMETIIPRVGYTGPGGEAYAFMDDTLMGALPGDSAARGAFTSLSTEARLTFTEKTKGAVSDAEMATFKAAVPSLTTRPEGNKLIAQVLRAGAARVQTRANFMEEWANKRGGMQGAEAAWDEYMRANPIIVDSVSGLQVQPEGNWREVIGRTAQVDLNPQTILGMTIDQLNGLDVSTMTLEQVDAAQRRYDQLNGQAQ